jgi:hypothetical protein
VVTDAELRDAATAALRLTTVNYQQWATRVMSGSYPDVTKTQWWKAFYALEQIGKQQPVPSWPPVDTTPPAWTPTRTFMVSTEDEFASRYGTVVDGDRIVADGGLIFNRQLNLNRRFTGRGIEIRFEDHQFRGDRTGDLNAVYVTGTKHRIFGGELSNPAGHGILFHSSSDILWHGFKVDGVGGTCLRVFATGGNVDRLDLVGEVTRCGGDLSLDPHQERGSGLHPTYVGGVATFPSALAVKNSRFVIDAHDCPTGSNQVGPCAFFNDFYIRARNLTFVAKTQTGGNAVQPFGDSGENDIWVEADNVAQVVRPAGNLGRTLVFHGRGTNVRGNYDSTVPYMPHPAVTYQDCT